jgi:poly(3-hydroxybutyrate) depolymerase
MLSLKVRSASRRAWETLHARHCGHHRAACRVGAGARCGSHVGSLEALNGFGSNPGNLKAFIHIPGGLAPNAPLASGWSELADEQGFALLYPEQQRSNNANGCFN